MENNVDVKKKKKVARKKMQETVSLFLLNQKTNTL